ncbi:MAG: histidinol dehydrogenase [Anaerolineales bacterium]|nr:histidinol dehydrogenase [Anaerolineales bacterium]MDP2776965.1 histidinol dehydrogenase [Anaerolineales bacterium]
MLKQYDPQTAKQTILQRTPPDEFPVSQRVLDGIAKLFGEPLTVEQAVTKILKDVRANGDTALQKWTQMLDGMNLPPTPISQDAIQSALDSLAPEKRIALEKSAVRIEGFHRRQPLTSWFTNELGGTLGQIIRPIQRVGLYVPGGTAPLPSTVLMSAIPARVAGVKEIIVVTPPSLKPPSSAAGTSREHTMPPVDPMILAACAIAGVDKVYLLGGAQAIGALAYGTETIQPVDKIFGPGNLFVTLAKRQVYGVVGIDGLAGPTETVVIADESANPAWVAADMLAQAEHDLLASAILLTPSQTLIEKVIVEVGGQFEQRSRADIILASLENRGGAVLTRDLDEAVQLANDYAPEHLALSVSDPWRWVEKVNNAGGVFLGEHSFEVLGDYLAGPSHVMPTGGSARFASPLNVWDFIKIISLVALDENTVQTIGSTAATIATSEGLDAHANAALLRLEKSA